MENLCWRERLSGVDRAKEDFLFVQHLRQGGRGLGVFPSPRTYGGVAVLLGRVHGGEVGSGV